MMLPTYSAYVASKGAVEQLLKSRMNTVTGRIMAARRHEFMVMFLEEFFGEWEQATDSLLDADWRNYPE